MLVLRFTKTHTLNRIINYSTLKIFRVFNFRRNAISTKINYGENFRIYGMYYELETADRHERQWDQDSLPTTNLKLQTERRMSYV